MTLTKLLESVRRVEVRTNRRGMDFEELREYLPGDDATIKKVFNAVPVP